MHVRAHGARPQHPRSRTARQETAPRDAARASQSTVIESKSGSQAPLQGALHVRSHLVSAVQAAKPAHAPLTSGWGLGQARRWEGAPGGSGAGWPVRCRQSAPSLQQAWRRGSPASAAPGRRPPEPQPRSGCGLAVPDASLPTPPAGAAAPGNPPRSPRSRQATCRPDGVRRPALARCTLRRPWPGRPGLAPAGCTTRPTASRAWVLGAGSLDDRPAAVEWVPGRCPGEAGGVIRNVPLPICPRSLVPSLDPGRQAGGLPGPTPKSAGSTLWEACVHTPGTSRVKTAR